MDEAGIDIQVLSHGAPSTQKLPADDRGRLTRRVNDRLHAVVAANPKRFAAFAALPTAVPEAAADELERTAKLGFKGAMLHGLANGSLPRRQALLADLCARRRSSICRSICIRRCRIPTCCASITSDYVKDFPMLTRPAWGYTVETATLAIRLVLSGVFEKYPKLKIILGHLGETLPFLVWRIDHTLARPGQKSMSFRDIFCNNFYITTSGNFSNPALLCCVMEMGIDHILFAVDWPFVMNPPATQMDGKRAALRRRQGQDPLRQRQAAAADVIASPLSPHAGRGWGEGASPLGAEMQCSEIAERPPHPHSLRSLDLSPRGGER